MATRRPKVPRSHFADGSSGAVSGPAAEADGAEEGIRHDDGGAGKAARTAASRRTGGGKRDDGAGASGPAGGSAGDARGRTSPLGSVRRRAEGARSKGERQPAGARGASATGPELRPVPAKAFSGRLLALAVVLLTITLLLAPSVRTFLQQRSEISALQQDIEAKKKQESDLLTEISRWSDPAYVKQQARDRVNMMMPGETGYWVYGGGNAAAPQDSAPSGSTGKANPGSLPWVDGLWLSIKRSANE